ncbi:MAG: hypothetical protein B7Z37_03135 [Verrucomicrobia bacterium 12-59-8]|nr:MAG: hypothetical protein B7Z37_03135 [Verrucomicrobia bacterium 12-59-8]
MLAKLFNPGGGSMPNDEVDDDNEPEQNASEPVVETAPTSPPNSGVDASELAKATAALTQAAQAMTGRANTPAPAPEPTQEQPRVWVTPEQIPTAMAQLMNSEDPAERIRGQTLFANALAGMIYRQFQEDVTEQYQPQFEGMVQERLIQAQQIQTFRQEFAQSYPVLVGSEAGNLVARHIVTEVGKEFTAQGKQPNWFDPAFKAAFNAKLKSLGIDPKAGVVNPAPAPNPKPAPVSRSNGARPVQPEPGTSTQADSMAAVLRTAGIRVG